MKKIVTVAILLLTFASMFCGAVMATTSGDENYNDYSNEISSGPGEAPDDGMAREEPRTRAKDA